MKREDLIFPRPPELQATTPAEIRLGARDQVRLMVSTPHGHTHATFNDLARFLLPGDLLVVNHSATLPASLPANDSVGNFIFNLSTHYGNGLWMGEPRWSRREPGPLPLQLGEVVQIAGLAAHLIASYPGIPSLWFAQFEGDIWSAMYRFGKPITYGYVEVDYPLEAYQTIFSTTPGSAEMPSAARPFTARALQSLEDRGIQIASLLLHTGVSSLEVESEDVEEHPLYPEAFHVPAATAQAVNAARAEGRRIIAVGTTAVRALESAWDGVQVRPTKGFTRLYVHPGRGVNVVDGLLSGLHDPATSHLAMLYAIAGQEMILSAYAEATREGYLWHEFGDSHLILPPRKARTLTGAWRQRVTGDFTDILKLNEKAKSSFHMN
jgi:S-adenosylmethionine:tRNA ribosyltransferase-isomerase